MALLSKLGPLLGKNLVLDWLILAARNMPDTIPFYNDYFDLLAGNEVLRMQVSEGISEEQIRQSWLQGLKKFKVIRKKYLLYADFE